MPAGRPRSNVEQCRLQCRLGTADALSVRIERPNAIVTHGGRVTRTITGRRSLGDSRRTTAGEHHLNERTYHPRRRQRRLRIGSLALTGGHTCSATTFADTGGTETARSARRREARRLPARLRCSRTSVPGNLEANVPPTEVLRFFPVIRLPPACPLLPDRPPLPEKPHFATAPDRDRRWFQARSWNDRGAELRRSSGRSTIRGTRASW
jgi:hypothetical protein